MNDASRYGFLRDLAVLGRELAAFVAVKRLDDLEQAAHFDEAVDLAALRKGEFKQLRAPARAAPAIASPSPLLARQRISVSAQGEMVVLTIGNAEIKMPYETALQLSQWLRVQGKAAKRIAGDSSRHWSSVGILEALK